MEVSSAGDHLHCVQKKVLEGDTTKGPTMQGDDHLRLIRNPGL